LQGIVTAELVAALQTVLQVAGKSGASRMRLE
jgi:hypothetical protein